MDVVNDRTNGGGSGSSPPSSPPFRGEASASSTSSPKRDAAGGLTNSTTDQPRTLLSPAETRAMCAFIKKLCKTVKLRSVTMCSALVFFHRFQTHRAAGPGGMQFDDYDMAIACVFLACKAEENTQHLKTILDAAHRIRTGSTVPLSKDEESMWKARERILVCERILLDTMSFNVTVEHAHLFAAKFIQSVLKTILDSLRHVHADPSTAEDASKRHRDDAKGLQQAASNILNDSLSTNMILKHPPPLVGIAAVVLASRFLKNKSQAGAQEIVERIRALETSGKVGDYAISELLPVEDELISTYELAENDSSPSTRHKERSSSVSSMEDHSKRARIDSTGEN